MVEWGKHDLGETGRRAGDLHLPLRTPARLRALGSSHKVANIMCQGPLSGKAWIIFIQVNSLPPQQVALVHGGCWEQALGELRRKLSWGVCSQYSRMDNLA